MHQTCIIVKRFVLSFTSAALSPSQDDIATQLSHAGTVRGRPRRPGESIALLPNQWSIGAVNTTGSTPSGSFLPPPMAAAASIDSSP
jgi:hypothetical protein